MENRINIAEILRNCPKGMELDCTMLDNVVFEKIDFSSSHHPIIIRRIETNTTIHLTKYGQYSNEEDYKCIIFPKGKTTWEGFVPPCKFKVGDKIAKKNSACVPMLITQVSDECYYSNTGSSIGVLPISEQDNYELVPNKFDIATLKSFDKVLVRDNNRQEWTISLFSRCIEPETCKYSCINGYCYAQCIPYEGNQRLLGTTDECSEFYKNWE